MSMTAPCKNFRIKKRENLELILWEIIKKVLNILRNVRRCNSHLAFVPVEMFTPRQSVLRFRHKRKIDNGLTATVLTRGSCKIITNKTRKSLKSKKREIISDFCGTTTHFST